MAARNDRPPYAPSDLVAGRYAIRRILGEGGASIVYSALDVTCGRKVALKVMRPDVAARHPGSADLVKREATTLVSLRQRTPHVVEVLTAGVTEDAHRLPYYVMERLHGTTLRAAIDERRALGRPYELLEMLGIATEIAAALVVAHEMGVVHGDIKPDNVYLATDRDFAVRVKLLDFGVGALAHDEPAVPGRRAFRGSRAYASPEQLDGRPATAESDIYSFHLILFEMLTFTLPHDRLGASSVTQTSMNVLEMPVPRVRDLRADVPERLDNLILNCLETPVYLRISTPKVASKLRLYREQFEEALTGVDVNATDVSGTPVEVFAQHLDNATGTAPPRLDGSAIDRPRQDRTLPLPVEDVFFNNPVVQATLRIPQVLAAPAPASPEATARLPAQPPLVLIPPWRDLGTVPAAPRRRVSRGPLLFLLASLMFALGTLVAWKVLRQRGALRNGTSPGPSDGLTIVGTTPWICSSSPCAIRFRSSLTSSVSLPALSRRPASSSLSQHSPQ
jgi:serine/threonine protein kinase